MPRRKPIIMVSSVVYGMQDLLDQVYAVLASYGYEVWMSHKGTVPTDPKLSAIDNCVLEVRNCDVFLGFITGSYGSGITSDGLSVTHKELQEAIRLRKPRWFLVHHNIVVARQLLKPYRFGPDGRPLQFEFKQSKILDSVHILEMYEQAMQIETPLASRTGNWVQTYFGHADVLNFLDAQFRDRRRIVEILRDIDEERPT